MEISIKTILVFIVITLFRSKQCDSSTCFIESLVVINSVHWLLRAIVGKRRERTLRDIIRKGDLLILHSLEMLKAKVTAWLVREIRRRNPPYEFIFILRG